MFAARGVERETRAARVVGQDVAAVPVDPVDVRRLFIVEAFDFLLTHVGLSTRAVEEPQSSRYLSGHVLGPLLVYRAGRRGRGRAELDATLHGGTH